MPVFTRMTGQDFNLGDTALRRALLAQVATEAPAHVLVGDHAPDYVAALGLRDTDVPYADAGEYDAALRAHAERGPIVLIEKPGAFRAAQRLGAFRARLRDTLRIRRSGGAVLWLGGGLQHAPSRRDVVKMRVLSVLAEEMAWRDAGTARWFGCGEVMPDWAFALPPSSRAPGERRGLGVSIRGDRPPPPPAWLDAARRYCADRGFAPVVVSQVRIDDDHAQLAARRLGCEPVLMGDRTHLDQEQRVRGAYAGCALVLSDRLHVLILAMTEGAVPACLLAVREDKIERHLAAIGLSGLAQDVTGWTDAALTEAMDQALARAGEVAARRAEAEARVLAIGERARAIIRARLVP